MDKRCFFGTLAITLLILAAGCTAPTPVYRTVTVSVPVPVRVAPPPALVTPYAPAVLPVFLDPADPSAKVALSEEGARHLRAMVRELTGRDAAWRAWASSDTLLTND